MNTIQIGAQTWTIELVDDLDSGDAWGECDYDTATIRIVRGPKDIMRDTLLHEIMHAILCVAGVRVKKQIEEDIIKTLAPWLDVILDWRVRVIDGEFDLDVIAEVSE